MLCTLKGGSVGWHIKQSCPRSRSAGCALAFNEQEYQHHVPQRTAVINEESKRYLSMYSAYVRIYVCMLACTINKENGREKSSRSYLRLEKRAHSIRHSWPVIDKLFDRPCIDLDAVSIKTYRDLIGSGLLAVAVLTCRIPNSSTFSTPRSRIAVSVSAARTAIQLANIEEVP